MAHVELAGGAIRDHVDPVAGGDLAEGSDPSEPLRSLSLWPVDLPVQVVLIGLVDSTAVADAVVVDDLHGIFVAVGLQAVDGLVLAVRHRALRVVPALAALLDEVVVTEVGVCRPVKRIDLVLSVRNQVGVDGARAREAKVLWDLEFDLHALAVVAEAVTVTISLHVVVVHRQMALVVRAMRGLRHWWHHLGRLSQSLLVLLELADQRLEVIRGNYLLGILIAELPPLDLSLVQAIVRVVVDVLEAQGLRVTAIVVDQRLFNTFPRCPIVEYLQKFLFVFAFADLLIWICAQPAVHDLVLLGAM